MLRNVRSQTSHESEKQNGVPHTPERPLWNNTQTTFHMPLREERVKVHFNT